MRHASPILYTGLSLSVVMVGLAALSFSFPYGVVIAETPLNLYMGLALIAGGLWVILPWQIRQSKGTVPTILVIALIGLFMRGAMFFSLPVLEDDSYRYLWDGAVTARGIDPYKFAPAEVTPSPVFGDTIDRVDTQDISQLRALAEQNIEPYRRINFPYVATIYPPLAQAAFAAAYWLDPFGLSGWRWVLLGVDLLTFALLLKLLRTFDRAPVWISLYWWNPVVILQGFGAGHMDLLVLPFLLAAVLLAKQQRLHLATLVLAGGAAVKLWPILLFPLLVRPLLRTPIKLLIVSTLFAANLIFLLLPQLVHVLRPEAGLNAYATDLTRLPVLILSVIAALIFLSPTGYPWYFIWLAPFVPLVPSAVVLSLMSLAPLYWLRFQLGDESLIYQWVIVPIAFGLPLLLLLQSYIPRRVLDAVRHHHPRAQ